MTIVEEMMIQPMTIAMALFEEIMIEPMTIAMALFDVPIWGDDNWTDDDSDDLILGDDDIDDQI